MARKIYKNTIKELSDRLVARHQLPLGTQFRLLHTDGRKKRVDAVVSRYAINQTSHARADDEDTVATLLGELAELLVKPERCQVALFSPDGGRINGHTKIRTVRHLAPADSEPQWRQDSENREFEIQFLTEEASGALRELEFLLEDPEQTLGPAVLRALFGRFGREAVKQMLARELLTG